MGKKVATLFGKWDESIHYVNGDGSGKPNPSDASLLWKSSKPPNVTRYNLTSFAITLNELTPGLQVDMITSYVSYAFSFSSYASLIVFYSFVWSRVFDHGLRRSYHPRIPGSGRTSGIWRMENMKRQMQRNSGWRKGKEWYVWHLSLSFWSHAHRHSYMPASMADILLAGFKLYVWKVICYSYFRRGLCIWFFYDVPI